MWRVSINLLSCSVLVIQQKKYNCTWISATSLVYTCVGRSMVKGVPHQYLDIAWWYVCVHACSITISLACACTVYVRVCGMHAPMCVCQCVCACMCVPCVCVYAWCTCACAHACTCACVHVTEQVCVAGPFSGLIACGPVYTQAIWPLSLWEGNKRTGVPNEGFQTWRQK